jgi:hypothetical protein
MVDENKEVTDLTPEMVVEEYEPDPEPAKRLSLGEKLNSTKLLMILGMFITAMVYLAFKDQAVCIEIAKEAARAGLYMVLVIIGYRMPNKG